MTKLQTVSLNRAGEEPTTFLDQVYLGCTQRERKPNKNLVDEYRKMLESRNSAGAT